MYVLQNLLLIAKLAFKGSSKHSSCKKVLQASCLPSRFDKTKISIISTVCKYLHKQHALLLSFQHHWLIFFPPRISSSRHCQLVTAIDGKNRIIYFRFRRFLKFQIVSIFFPEITRILRSQFSNRHWSNTLSSLGKPYSFFHLLSVTMDHWHLNISNNN